MRTFLRRPLGLAALWLGVLSLPGFMAAALGQASPQAVGPVSAPNGPVAAQRREAQTLKQGLARRQPGEADTTFLRRVLPVSFPESHDLLAATWRPSAFGKQLFFSVRGKDKNEYGTDLLMLDPFQADTYAVYTFTIFTQGDLTDLAAIFFSDVDQNGLKELLTISECSLREAGGRETHYQTLVFRYDGLDNASRPRYHYDANNYAYLDELATVAAVRQALARHQPRPRPALLTPGKPAKK